MSLTKYKEKRNFKQTPEPAGKRAKKQSTHLLYLIQKHAASHLHYDFRLELEGVLKSWAVPKGPSLDPTIKRLAVHVEDHPMAYGGFEGTIPKGQYGGGTVMLWDTGYWKAVEKDALKAYQAGNLTVHLHGKKLKGLWKLIRIKTDPKNWLLIKVKDEYAQPESDFDVTQALPLSVKKNLSMEEIAEKSTKVWHSKETKVTKQRTLASKKSKK